MEVAIKYFTIFGGLDIKIDITLPISELIEKHILKDYTKLRNEVHYLSGGYSVEHAILSGIALGDRKTTTAFKRAHVSFEEGMKCVENLLERGIIESESSQFFIVGKRNESKVAKKLFFPTPFLRFWFAFVSPIYKGIKDGDFKEFHTKFENKIGEFSDFVFEELALSFLLKQYGDETTGDKIKQIGKYWDEKIELDLVALTSSNKIMVGNCKFTNSKIKKNELTKLTQDCYAAGIKPDIFFLFSKSGYSNELKELKSDNLRLFTIKHLKLLIS